MVQGLSGGAGVLLETICLDAKAAASATMAIDWGVQGAAQTQAPSGLHVLATMQFSFVFNMGFLYVAWSSVAQAGLPAPNAGIKHVPYVQPQSCLRGTILGTVLKCRGNHFWVYLSLCLTRLFPGAQYMNVNLWPQKGWLHCCLREKSSYL